MSKPKENSQPSSEQQLQKDSAFMAQALELAQLGRYSSMPNPRVGCVIVKNDKVIAEGWHQRAGEPHAEIVALQKAGDQAAQSTVYVTLEPCCVQGQTGPCTEALIAAGVNRIVYAIQDPNPAVSGGGRDQLLAAGIEVSEGVLADEARELNKGFSRRMAVGVPWVLAKTASSLDGRIAMASGESQWITGEEARQQVQLLRAESCALLTGIGTVLADDPALTVRADQAGISVERQPAVIVVDSSLRTPSSAKLFSAAALVDGTDNSKKRRLIIAYSEASQGDVARLNDLGAECWHLPKASGGSDQRVGGVDLDALLKKAGEQAFNQLMVESGPTLLTSMIQQGLIDELVSFVAPKLLGGTAQPLLTADIERLADAHEFRLGSVKQCGNDVMLTLRSRH